MSVLKENKEKLLQGFYFVEELFRKNRIPWFLSHGTLLGFIRQKDFIAWDDDIDIGSFYNFANKKEADRLIKLLEFVGCSVMVDEFKEEECSLAFVKKLSGKTLSVGMKFWYKKGLRFKESAMHNYLYGQFNLKEVEFYQRKVLVPDYTEELFRIWYGDNWRKQGRKLWVDAMTFKPYCNQKIAYREKGALEAFVECDRHGEIIKPLKFIGRSIRSM